MKRVAIAGAGFSGATLAHTLAHSGYEVDVFETRPHVAGNCHTFRDPKTGILVHAYGPHIFHTDNERVWNFVRQFDDFLPFTNRVKAQAKGRMYSLPINLMTINQYFEKVFSPTEAAQFLEVIGDKSITAPVNFEQQALKFLGRDLYEVFFKGYTIKQWGVHPTHLPASILRRLPIRFDYNDNYYNSRFQGMPLHGYTNIIEKLLSHKAINLTLNAKFDRTVSTQYHHTFCSGSIDDWFGFTEGRLSYRTLDFVVEHHVGDYQGNPVINYCDLGVPWTRISEHKHFAPWERYNDTLIFKEYSRSCEPNDIPYYPIRLVDDKSQLASYVRIARNTPRTTFLGRLGTYRYLDMHVAIAEALAVADRFALQDGSAQSVPAFFNDPLA